jgi:hypothetical protein
MKTLAFAAALALAGATFAGGASAATCQAEKLMCSTTMPVGGYCECTSRGTTLGGTVVDTGSKRPVNATAGGCGDHPNAPGCH